MLKEKRKGKILTILPIIIILISLIIFFFYWYEFRPSQIKHSCSWVKEVHAAVPARAAMTEKELYENGIIEKCEINSTVNDPKEGNALDQLLFDFSDYCPEKNKKIIEEYSKSQEEIPEKETWRKSTDIEYNFCLRDKGL